MELQETKKLHTLLSKRQYPGMFLLTISIKGDKAILNGEEMGSIEAVNRATSKLMPMAMECTCFKNGSWVKSVMYCEDLDEIMKQKEEDYDFDMQLINFITCLKVMANKCLKGNDTYFGCYDDDSWTAWYVKNEEIQEQIDELESEE